jgi:hypothetical protein
VLTTSKGVAFATYLKTAIAWRQSPINRCAAITGQCSAAAGCADIIRWGWCVMPNVNLIHGDCMDKKTERSLKISESLKRGSFFNCINCNKSFWRKPYEIKRGHNKFCSIQCYQFWQKGKRKISGFTLNPLKKENNPNWKGGITPNHILERNSNEYKQWRDNVFARDNYTCQSCNSRCGNGFNVILHAHHIKKFSEHPKLRFDTDNGKTLCMDCHHLEHTKNV